MFPKATQRQTEPSFRRFSSVSLGTDGFRFGYGGLSSPLGQQLSSATRSAASGRENALESYERRHTASQDRTPQRHKSQIGRKHFRTPSVSCARDTRHNISDWGAIGSLKGYYLFHHNHVRKRSLDQSDVHHNTLNTEPEVRWVQQQHEKLRFKRDYSTFDQDFVRFPGFRSLVSPGSRMAYRDTSTHNIFPDPLFKEQWYLNGGAKDGPDMNVGPAWQKGYTGKGVVVSILDDGIQRNHPDLALNYGVGNEA
uniref:Peptidase S8 pro-domain domain-containing protein n=1 Tax=Anopheles atroparvus TaxID=41427 RepID=A0A182IX67_ANOAO